MSLPAKGNSKRHGGFQPFDTLTNSSSSPNETVRDRWSSKTPKNQYKRSHPAVWSSQRAKSEAIISANQEADSALGSFDKHSVKRLKMSRPSEDRIEDSLPLGAQEETHPFRVSSDAKHISYHSKTSNQPSQIEDPFDGSVPSYRSVEDTMNPTLRTRHKLLTCKASSIDRYVNVGDDGGSDDFEMCGMENDKTDQAHDEFLNGFKVKSVARSKPKQSSTIHNRQDILDRISEDAPSWQTNGRVRATPEIDQEHQATLSKEASAERSLGKSLSHNTVQGDGSSMGGEESSLKPKQKLTEIFQRDNFGSTKLSPENTDELQQSQPRTNSVTVEIPLAPEQHSAETSNPSQDTLYDTKKQSKIVSQKDETYRSKGDFGIKRKEKPKKEGVRKHIKPVECLSINAEDYPDKVDMECDRRLRTFKIRKRNGEVARNNKGDQIEIDVGGKESFESAQVAHGDTSRLIRLQKREGKRDHYSIFVLFTCPEDLRWFRTQLTLLNCNLKVQEIDEYALDRAYDNRKLTPKRRLRDNLMDENGSHMAQSNSIHQRLTRSQRQRGLTNGGEQKAIEGVQSQSRPARFLPYSAAMANGSSWKKPLQYPPGAARGEIAVVEEEELEHLGPDTFLNDSLIWFGIRYMLEQHPESRARVHCFNTYFYPSLSRNSKSKGIDYNAVKRWTSKQQVDIFSKDYVIVPINQELHWHLAIICNLKSIELRRRQEEKSALQLKSDEPQETSIITRKCAQISLSPSHHDDFAINPNQQEILPGIGEYVDMSMTPTHEPNMASVDIKEDMEEQKGNGVDSKSDPSSKTPLIISLDSLGSGHRDVIRNLREYLIEEAKEKHSADIEVPIAKVPKDIPKQENFCDCGLFLIEYVKRFIEDPSTFVDNVLNDKMNISYWPQTVADLLRDNFREIVCKEGCKQNDIPPHPGLSGSKLDVDQSAADQESAITISDTNTPFTGLDTASKTSMVEDSDIEPPQRNGVESKVSMESDHSSRTDFDDDFKMITETRTRIFQNGLTNRAVPPTNSNREEKQFYRSSIETGNLANADPLRPITRGKKI